LEKKRSIWLESHKKRAKGRDGFRGYHSIVDHLIMLRIIVEEYCNNKNNLVYCFVEFRKYFDTMPKTNLWNRLEELKVPFGLRVVVVRLYENIIVKFRDTKGWSEEINYNIEVKQGCPPIPYPFGIYINKLKDCLEANGCLGPNIASIVIICLLYVDDIVLMARNPYDLSKRHRILRIYALVHV